MHIYFRLGLERRKFTSSPIPSVRVPNPLPELHPKKQVTEPSIQRPRNLVIDRVIPPSIHPSIAIWNLGPGAIEREKEKRREDCVGKFVIEKKYNHIQPFG